MSSKKQEYAIKYLELAKKAISLNKIEDSIRICTKAIEFDPTLIEAYTIRGQAYEAIGDIENSLLDLDKVISLDTSSNADQPKPIAKKESSNNKSVDENTQIEEYYKKAKDVSDDNQGDDSIKILKEGLSKFPKSFKLQYLLADIFRFYIKTVESCMSEYEKALTLASNNKEKAQVFYGYSQYYKYKENPEEIIKNLSIAIKLDGENEKYYDSRAITYFREKRYEDALNDYSKLIELNPNDAQYWGNKGGVLKKLDRDNESKKCFYKAIDLAPTDYERYKQFLEFVDWGKWQENIDINQLYINRAGKINESNIHNIAEAYNDIGYAYGIKDNYSHAIHNYTKAINCVESNIVDDFSKPFHAHLYYKRAHFNRQTNEFYDAYNDYGCAVKIYLALSKDEYDNDLLTDCLFHQGKCAENMGNTQLAKHSYIECVKYGDYFGGRASYALQKM